MNRQMLYLFISSFSIVCVGFGLFPLLPIYAGSFGATPTAIGIYLALTYVSITLGSMLAGWLSGKVSRRLTLAVAGFAGVIALVLNGQATSLWQVTFLTGTVWFTGGVGLANINVLTGLNSKRGNRGKSFSWIALTNPLGAIIGSLMVGQLVEWKGYPVMFAVMAVEYAIWPVLALTVVREGTVLESNVSPSNHPAAASPDRVFLFLLLSVLLTGMTISINRLGLSLTMKDLDYSAGAISGTNVIGGLVSIPIIMWSGKLADRLGSKMFLLVGYLLAALGSLVLVTTNGQLWSFWLIASSILMANSMSASLALALATDILPPAALGRNLPWVYTAVRAAGVVGFAASGVVIDLVGATSLFVIASGLSLGSIILATPLPGSMPVLNVWKLRKRATSEPAPQVANSVANC